MKKRSLFAAVAMLIVSAIVLTSATYAWFASSTTAAVNQITASVSNTDGSLYVKANEPESAWKLQLSASELGYSSEGNVLNPVDFSWNGAETTPTIKKVEFDGQTFSGLTNAATTDYISYTFHVKATANGTIDLKPTFAADTEGKNFVYGYVLVDGTTGYKFASAGSDSYYPIDSASFVSAVDGNNNSIVDDADTGSALLSKVEITANPNSIQISTTADASHTVQVFVWAEGQDAGCAGIVSANGNGFSFAPAFAQDA